MSETHRRLAAILAADVVGYSTMVGEDEPGTLGRVRAMRIDVVEPLAADHGGRLFKTTGDGFLLVFASAVQALRCAIAIQDTLRAQPDGLRVRIGVHQGEVVPEGDDLLGDGVIVASRLEPLAEPGGICISVRVREDAAGKMALDVEDLGERPLRNLAAKVRVFRVRLGAAEGPVLPPPSAYARFRSSRPRVWSAGTVVLAVLVVGGLAFLWQRGPPVTGAAPAGTGEAAALPVSAEPPPDRLTRDCPTCPQLVLIPPGSFVMGVPSEEDDREGVSRSYDDDARPPHKVTIAQAFWLGRYPVTRGEYAAFVEDTGYQGGGTLWHEPGFPQTDRDPVVNVSITDAAAYIRWLSRRTGNAYRLPSEAEWEYAARSGTTTAQYWGDDLAAACTYANVADETLRKNFQGQVDKDRYFPCDDGYANTSPVGTFQPNGFGLSDMLGNVWQWVADPWHANYQGAPADGSVWASEDATGRRILRGGSWSGNPGGVRAGTRGKADPGSHFTNGGFRVARSR